MFKVFNVKYFFIILVAASFGFFSSCSKGVSLKISDQDVYAFGSQESCNFITSNGYRISWKSSPPISFIITADVPAEYDSEISKAVDIWNKGNGHQLITVYRNNNLSTTPAVDQVNAIYWMKTWDDDLPKQQARTGVHWDGNKLTDADIRINGKNFTFYKDGDVDTFGKVHFQSLILHEFGHALGLVHIEQPDSVMQAYLKSQTVRVQPASVDLNSLSCEY